MAEKTHKLGIYQRLQDQYVKDPESCAADLAYAALCLSDDYILTRIARKEKEISLEVGLALVLSSVDEKVKARYCELGGGSNNLRQFLQAAREWTKEWDSAESTQANRIPVAAETEEVDKRKIMRCSEWAEASRRLGCDWYAEFLAWAIVPLKASTEERFNGRDVDEWLRSVESLWNTALRNRFHMWLLFKALFCLFLESEDRESVYGIAVHRAESRYGRYRGPDCVSFDFAAEVVADCIAECPTQVDPFSLYSLADRLSYANWDGTPAYDNVLRKAGENGVSEACYDLAHWYNDDEKTKESRAWLLQGAELGCPYCQNWYAERCEDGKVSEGDRRVATQWHSKALSGFERVAEYWDHAMAMRYAGDYYRKGTGGRKVDLDKAHTWYRAAIALAEEMNDQDECQEIIVRQYEAYASKSLDLEMLSDLETAAASGDAAAMQLLGDCYLAGTQVMQNLDRACEWYRKAAEETGCSLFLLGVTDDLTEYAEYADRYKTITVFQRILDKGRRLNLLRSDRFHACYKLLPDYKVSVDDSAEERRIRERVKRVKLCFGRHDPKFVEEMAGILENSSNGYWDTWALGSKKSNWIGIRKYFPGLIDCLLDGSPDDLAAFIKARKGRLYGFGLAQFSELCFLCRPAVYFVFNGASLLRDTVQECCKTKDGTLSNYPLVCKTLGCHFDRMGFTHKYRGYLFDRFFYKKAPQEEEFPCMRLVEAFRKAVSVILATGTSLVVSETTRRDEGGIDSELFWRYLKSLDDNKTRTLDELVEGLPTFLEAHRVAFTEAIGRRFVVWCNEYSATT